MIVTAKSRITKSIKIEPSLILAWRGEQAYLIDSIAKTDEPVNQATINFLADIHQMWWHWTLTIDEGWLFDA
jgi:hypothetical protein